MTSFPIMTRGKWMIKVSASQEDTILVLAVYDKPKNSGFIDARRMILKCFSDESAASDFIDMVSTIEFSE